MVTVSAPFTIGHTYSLFMCLAKPVIELYYKQALDFFLPSLKTFDSKFITPKHINLHPTRTTLLKDMFLKDIGSYS